MYLLHNITSRQNCQLQNVTTQIWQSAQDLLAKPKMLQNFCDT